jgi:hypothetical protein
MNFTAATTFSDQSEQSILDYAVIYDSKKFKDFQSHELPFIYGIINRTNLSSYNIKAINAITSYKNGNTNYQVVSNYQSLINSVIEFVTICLTDELGYPKDTCVDRFNYIGYMNNLTKNQFDISIHGYVVDSSQKSCKFVTIGDSDIITDCFTSFQDIGVESLTPDKHLKNALSERSGLDAYEKALSLVSPMRKYLKNSTNINLKTKK